MYNNLNKFIKCNTVLGANFVGSKKDNKSRYLKRNYHEELVFTLLVLLTSSAFANPHFTIGSNPFYTYFAYPHDILNWPNAAIFSHFYPQTLPWQGHVTNLSQRPNDTYISNYNNFDFPVPNGYTGDPNDIKSFMRASSYVYQNRFSLGGIWNFGDWGKHTWNWEPHK